jgi:DNA-binding NarL/FixJ family response regulator
VKTPTETNSGKPRKRLLLVEDHPVTREGFAQLLNFEPDLQVWGHAGTAPQALAALGLGVPDLVIIDISLGGTNGLELIKDLAGRYPELPMLVLSTHDETLYAERSLRAGARGYIMKSAPTEHILGAIRLVLAGKTYVSERMNEHLLARFTRKSSGSAGSEMGLLTDRELDVFQLLGHGRSTTQIAVALNLSPSTVATHRMHIQEKLGITSLTELVCRAAVWSQTQAEQP